MSGIIINISTLANINKLITRRGPHQVIGDREFTEGVRVVGRHPANGAVEI